MRITYSGEVLSETYDPEAVEDPDDKDAQEKDRGVGGSLEALGIIPEDENNMSPQTALQLHKNTKMKIFHLPSHRARFQEISSSLTKLRQCACAAKLNETDDW